MNPIAGLSYSFLRKSWQNTHENYSFRKREKLHEIRSKNVKNFTFLERKIDNLLFLCYPLYAISLFPI
jgi:hypothetical protein